MCRAAGETKILAKVARYAPRSQGTTCVEFPPQTSTSSDVPKNQEMIKQYDILCGRHKLAFNNIGNRRFRVTISLWLDRYIAATTRAHKTRVVILIIDVLLGAGARFFKHDASTDSWVTLSTKEIRAKVGHAIRDMLAAKDMTSHASFVSSATSQLSSSSSSTETRKAMPSKKMTPPSIVTVPSIPTAGQVDGNEIIRRREARPDAIEEIAGEFSVTASEWGPLNDDFETDDYELIKEFLSGQGMGDFDTWCEEVVMAAI
jgi:hypothetical protein